MTAVEVGPVTPGEPVVTQTLLDDPALGRFDGVCNRATDTGLVRYVNTTSTLKHLDSQRLTEGVAPGDSRILQSVSIFDTSIRIEHFIGFAGEPGAVIEYFVVGRYPPFGEPEFMACNFFMRITPHT